MANENNGKKFVVGAVVGTLLGAVTALLLAPKSGRELRADLAEGYECVSEKTQQVAGEVGVKTKELATALSEQSNTAVQTIRSQTSEWAGKAKELALQARDEVKAWRASKSTGSVQKPVEQAPVAATAVEEESGESVEAEAK
ncbi:YtxH domain-containing protein [Paenibacillus sp. YYML68]|uniref:YtxH domain-containing protein n=1 Tax=Paenibacillus sp. YYML68 TaxID=2909250 RepID=UPI0024936229|nr:YtxH domain-containing protein [Paenibacillus sp. YYML68]